MANLTKECKDKINSVPLHRLIGGLEGSGMTKYCKCPNCGKEGKLKGKRVGLHVVDDDIKNKHFVKCHSCDFKAGGGAINVMMTINDMQFMDACRKIADQTGITLEFEQPRQDKRRLTPQNDKSSFCSRQLQASGLTYDDVKAKVFIGQDECTVSPFRRGALDVYTGKIDEFADEMLILYYDLEGRRRKCIPSKNKSREVDYTRVRWANPEAHKDKRGKPTKYQTIAGATTPLYIPQLIRSLYKSKQRFETLFIQEGEKKAEKACKHGIPSIAIQGIGNIGRKEEGLPDEIQYLVQACSIKNIVFLMDSDWNDLKSTLNDNDSVDIRPREFARALIKFRKYVATLAQCGIYVDIWHAHINANEGGDKGIDDLLVNTLKGREEELRHDIDRAMIAHDGEGKYIDIINVTSYSDTKILELWKLNNKDDFFAVHKERLLQLKSFKFGNVFYKVADGKISMATEFGEGKDFWSVSYEDKGKKVAIDLLDMLSFLTANGFRSRKGDDGKRSFLKIDRGVIIPKDEYDLRNFVLSYVYKATKDHDIHLCFAETISNRLSNSNLCQLELLVTNAGRPTSDAQRFYFLDRQVAISASNIDCQGLVGPVWEQNLIQRNFERVQIIESFRPDGNGSFEITLTEDGKECEFFRFLCNTSNQFRGSQMNRRQESEYRRHIANKLSCIGYLLRDYKNITEARAVISMDATMSEVGVSSGRSGKSFIGAAIEKFVSQTEIDGPGLTNDDQYMFSGVTRQTKNIFIDDIQQNFSLDKFKQKITGALNVNIKQGGRFVVPFEEAPKFYITSNHALDGLNDSTRARLVFMSFSNWYNTDHRPIQEFGHQFFTGWDERQWTLFDNLMCECVQIYMRVQEQEWSEPGRGTIDPPMEGLMLRELRQEMGELFLQWASVYFATDGPNVNRRTPRKAITEAYLNEFGLKATQLTAKTFRNKLVAYCRFSGLHLNAHRPDRDGNSFADNFARNPDKSFIGDRDVSQSLEFYTINTTDYLIRQELQ